MRSTSTDFDRLITTPHFVADPYSILHRLRAEAPVYWSEAIWGWILTKYDDILVSFKDTTHFSNENRLGKAIAYLTSDRQSNLNAFSEHFATKSLLHSDPPDHTRMRALITREFNAKVVDQMKPQIQKTVDALIDAAREKGHMDVVSELASPLPISVIAQILGVPACDRHLFKVWADDLLAFQGVNKPSEHDLFRAQKAIVEMRPYIADMIKDRRRRPQEDLITKFAQAEAESGQISETELISTTVTLFVAGQETTISLISNSIYSLLANPDQLTLLRQNPDLLGSAVEESLRYESPVSRQPRLMKSDIVVGGQRLEQGDMVFQMINAANRDPAYFSDPDKFDIVRERNRHIAFGYGIHFCVGAVLSRAEAAIAIGTALGRLPNLSLVEKDADWDLEKRNSRVLNRLNVTL